MIIPPSGYSAPMDIYKEFHSAHIRTIVQPIYSDVNVCVGKEWYRFPSSFYLPSPKWKLRFIKSGFKGQLPKPYTEGRNGTLVVPTDMNEMNREEPSRYVSHVDIHGSYTCRTNGSTISQPTGSYNSPDCTCVQQ